MFAQSEFDFFFNVTSTTGIYTEWIVGGVRGVYETGVCVCVCVCVCVIGCGCVRVGVWRGWWVGGFASFRHPGCLTRLIVLVEYT